MKRTFIALCTASALGLAVPLIAQSTTTTAKYDDKDTTITGCVQKNKSGGFWLTDAMPASKGSASSSTTASSTSGTTGTTGSATTTADDKDISRAASHRMWNLENAHDLDRYVNQKIEVTGRAKKDTSGDELVGTTGREMQARDFDVKSVTLVATSCS
jgi:hypothetical protein